MAGIRPERWWDRSGATLTATSGSYGDLMRRHQEQPSRGFVVSALICAGMVVLSGSLQGCSGDDGTPTATPTPWPDELTPTPSATPIPLQLDDGTYTLFSLYALGIKPKGSDITYILKPQGTAILTAGALTGSVKWGIYAGSDAYASCTATCYYEETITGEYDGSIYPSVGCVDCGTYYSVHLAPPATTDCSTDALNALLDTNADGVVSSTEASHVDQWGFSPTSEGDYPPAWTEFPNWTSLESSLEYYSVPYAAWSRQWHSSSSAYLPLYALYPVALPEPCAQP